MDFLGEGRGSWRRFIRIRVEVDIKKSLLPRVFLLRLNLPDLWIGLKYEKIADIYDASGIIGHERQTCHGKIFKLRKPFGHTFNDSGPWIRPEDDSTPKGIFSTPTNGSDQQANLATTPPSTKDVRVSSSAAQAHSPSASYLSQGTTYCIDIEVYPSCHSPLDPHHTSAACVPTKIAH